MGGMGEQFKRTPYNYSIKKLNKGCPTKHDI